MCMLGKHSTKYPEPPKGVSPGGQADSSTLSKYAWGRVRFENLYFFISFFLLPGFNLHQGDASVSLDRQSRLLSFRSPPNHTRRQRKPLFFWRTRSASFSLALRDPRHRRHPLAPSRPQLSVTAHARPGRRPGAGTRPGSACTAVGRKPGT